MIDFEEIKSHEIFEKATTDILENFAYLLGDSEGCKFEDLISQFESKIQNPEQIIETFKDLDVVKSDTVLGKRSRGVEEVAAVPEPLTKRRRGAKKD